MPKAPDIFDKINFIIKAIFDPCDAPLTVYVETALPALLEAFITYYLLDFSQIFTSFVTPSKAIGRARSRRKGGMGSKAGRKGKKGIVSKVIGLDPSDEIGKNLPGAERVRGRVVTGGVIHMWQVFGVIERINYWWFVLSIVIDFFFNWFSGLAKTFYCEHQGSAMLVVDRETLPMIGGAGWLATSLFNIQKIRGEIEWFGNNGVIGPLPFTAVFTATISNPTDNPGEGGIRLYAGTSESSAIIGQAFVNLDAGATGTLTVKYDGHGGTAFSLRDRAEGAHLVLTDIKFWVMSTEDE
jgi:hypothetical protein